MERHLGDCNGPGKRGRAERGDELLEDRLGVREEWECEDPLSLLEKILCCNRSCLLKFDGKISAAARLSPRSSQSFLSTGKPGFHLVIAGAFS